MRSVIILLALFLILLGSNCYSIDRAEELVWFCQEESFTYNRGYCHGYLGGILDAYAVISHSYPQAKFICLPKAGISGEQTKNIFIKWVKDHPEQQHIAPRTAVLLSLRDAFPCSSEK